MNKGKVIYCDFRRTERRNQIDAILTDIYTIVNEVQIDKPDVTEDEIFRMPSVIKLQNQYADLILEEQDWGGCKYWK